MTKADTKYREDIIRMARQAGWEMDDSFVLEPQVIWYISQGQLERFTKLVAAHEREACAKLCDASTSIVNDYTVACNECAWAIRARGNT